MEPIREDCREGFRFSINNVAAETGEKSYSNSLCNQPRSSLSTFPVVINAELTHVGHCLRRLLCDLIIRTMVNAN